VQVADPQLQVIPLHSGAPNFTTLSNGLIHILHFVVQKFICPNGEELKPGVGGSNQ